MTGYRKGTTPASEMAAVENAFASCAAAIYALPDADEAVAACARLQALIGRLQREAADFRAWTALGLVEHTGLSQQAVAGFLGVSQPAVSKLLARARERGNPVTEPLTMPEQPHVALAVLTSEDQGSVWVCVARRVDKVPPWTFPGGEMQPGEAAAAAMRRRVLAETGLDVPEHVFAFKGRRIHELTSRVTVYGHAAVEPGRPGLANSDPDDLAEVQWVSVADTVGLMPTMYGPVRQLLDELGRA